MPDNTTQPKIPAGYNKISPNPSSALVVSSPIPGVEKPYSDLPFEVQDQNSPKQEESLRKRAGKTNFIPADATDSFVFVYEPFYSNGLINVPYREVFNIYKKQGKISTEELNYRYRGIDVLMFKSQDFDEFENNRLLTFLPMSAGRYVILESFEITKNIAIAENVAQSSKYVEVFTEVFPRFNLTLKTVIFGSINIKVKQFFDIVIKLLTSGNKGRFFMFDVINNIKVTEIDIFSVLQTNTTPYYRLIPQNISYSRDVNDNNFVKITLSGLVADIKAERVI